MPSGITATEPAASGNGAMVILSDSERLGRAVPELFLNDIGRDTSWATLSKQPYETTHDSAFDWFMSDCGDTAYRHYVGDAGTLASRLQPLTQSA